MKRVRQKKEVIISAALERVDRATAQAEPTLNSRRIAVLAANAPEAVKYIAAVHNAVALAGMQADDGNAATETRKNGDEEAISRIAVAYLSKPAQAQTIANRTSTDCANLTSTRPEGIGEHVRSQTLVKPPSLGELAWGAFSYGESLRERQLEAEMSGDMLSHRKNRYRQLDLFDLSIIECAISYQDYEFDVGFMKHLSAEGAEIIHSVAMIIASDFNKRIDTAIRTAAAVLIDPIVGGDADLCLCLLRSRRLPAHWNRKYHLKVDSPTR